MTARTVLLTTQGQPTMDGAGVKLTRFIGSQKLSMLDPFLLLDCFESENPDDYIAGFPSHPHRGFETVTYLLHGRMRHQDSAGNEGVIEPGGIQWMTAGKGIIHSEMPEQDNGLLKGFQLWVNLPASQKMCAPGYQEFPADQVEVEQHPDGTQIRVIAGTTNTGTQGVIKNNAVDPLYFDVSLPEDSHFQQSLPEHHNSFIYVVDGEVSTGNRTLTAGTLAVLSSGDRIEVTAHKGSRFLLLAGKPLKEPVVRSGPFVMNTREQVLQAFYDFRNNRIE